MFWLGPFHIRIFARGWLAIIVVPRKLWISIRYKALLELPEPAIPFRSKMCSYWTLWRVLRFFVVLPVELVVVDLLFRDVKIQIDWWAERSDYLVANSLAPWRPDYFRCSPAWKHSLRSSCGEVVARHCNIGITTSIVITLVVTVLLHYIPTAWAKELVVSSQTKRSNSRSARWTGSYRSWPSHPNGPEGQVIADRTMNLFARKAPQISMI